jgi:hypothetical protein
MLAVKPVQTIAIVVLFPKIHSPKTNVITATWEENGQKWDEILAHLSPK